MDNSGAHSKVYGVQVKAYCFIWWRDEAFWKLFHIFLDCWRFDGYVHVLSLIDAIANLYILFLPTYIFLQVRRFDIGDLWVVHFCIVQLLFNSCATKFLNGISKICSIYYQPGWKFYFLVHSLVIFNNYFGISDILGINLLSNNWYYWLDNLISHFIYYLVCFL